MKMNDIYLKKKKGCKYCFGTGVQTNKQTGIRQPCPQCHGTGIEHQRKPKIIFSKGL